MTTYHHIAARLFNTPLALCPQKAQVILTALGPRLGISKIKGPAAEGPFEKKNFQRKPFEIFDGVAFLPIHGSLIQRHSFLTAESGLMSYGEISEAFHAAMDDPAVRAVYMDVDSPGGEVAGLFDLVDSMAARVGEKPIHAHVNELSASAAYAITTVADHISIPRTGMAGSVGVIVIHQEFSRMLDQEGVTVNIIRAGDRKADFNQYEELSGAARRDVQSDIDRIREIFIQTVARNRGTDPDAVRETEAALLAAPAALDTNLVDEIMSAEEAAAHLMSRIGQ